MQKPNSILRKNRRFAICLIASLYSVSAAAQPDFSQASIKTTEVTPGIYVLQGFGGNIGVSVGEDGVFLIDDQFAPLSDKIQAAIAELTDQPVRFLINTHWHIDHTGGNEAFGQQGAIIVAHRNVRKRLKKGQFVVPFNTDFPAAPKAALPVVTFDREITFHWNDETMEVIHLADAHTDGDAVIYFKSANVVHTGDLFWNGLYPVIDASSGGSCIGMINGVADLLAHIDSSTRIIPGHGPVGSKDDLQAYYNMLKSSYASIKALKNQGKTLEEVVAAKPTSEFDEQWGAAILKPEQWVGMVYATLAQ